MKLLVSPPLVLRGSFLKSTFAKQTTFANHFFPLPQVPRSCGVLRDALSLPPPCGHQLLNKLHHLLLCGEEVQRRAQTNLARSLQL